MMKLDAKPQHSSALPMFQFQFLQCDGQFPRRLQIAALPSQLETLSATHNMISKDLRTRRFTRALAAFLVL